MPLRPSALSWSVVCLLLFLGLAPNRAQAQGFPPLPPDDLKMTSDPHAPGAPAIMLYREQDCDDNGLTSHQDNYIRIKVLTEEGRKYGNVELQFNKKIEKIVELHARTIQPDGSSVEFNGETFDKEIVKVKGLEYLAKTFTMPEVQVGSILEYRFTLDLQDHQVFSTHWIVSGPLFTREAKFSLKPYASHIAQVHLRWSWQGIPNGLVPKEGPDNIVRMELQNIPAFQEEDFMPPPNELKARVDFIYDHEYFDKDPDVFWQHVGRNQNEFVEKFIDKRKAMEAAVAQIVAPTDSPEVKLRKIYARVQQIRNKSFELRKSAQEIKRDKEKIDENVEDVWKRGYGTHRQLTWLFLALARSAGFEAYGVLISSRADYFFTAKTMEYWKLNSAVVLVKLDGKDLYLDPGAEFNSFGMLMWSETGVTGLRLDQNGGTWIRTPVPPSSDAHIQHTANLKLTDDGSLEGTVTTTYTGMEAMYHRLDVRNADDVTRKKFLEDRLRTQIAIPSASIKLTNSPDWESSETPLVAEFSLSIPGWASNAGRRLLIPAAVFGAGEKKTFDRTDRVHPIYFHYPYQKEDDVTIELPSGWQVGNVPTAIAKDGAVVAYDRKVENNKTSLHLTRKLAFNFLILDPKYYLALRDFYQNVRAGDEQQIVLEPATAAEN